MDLALNNLQRLICHKTQQTKPNHLLIMLSAKQGGIKYHFFSLWYDYNLGLNPGLPNHSRTISSLGNLQKVLFDSVN